jgi:hypothetical protein
MSLWGYLNLALHNLFFSYNLFSNKVCLGLSYFNDPLNIILSLQLGCTCNNITPIKISNTRIRANLRIGPHNYDILSIIFGRLLGDGHAEFRKKGKGTRICFYQEAVHVSYLIWLHELISNLGYCSSTSPKITTRLGTQGKVRKIIRFKT